MLLSACAAQERSIRSEKSSVEAEPGRAKSQPIDIINQTLIDLSHTFNQQTIYWPTENGFHLIPEKAGITDKGYYYSSNRFMAAEHGGTHQIGRAHV